MSPYIYFFFSFFICLVLTPVIRNIAYRKGWVAVPKKDRWHQKPTALMGGIAIYVSIAVPLFFLSDFSTLLPSLMRTDNSGGLPQFTAVLWVGVTFLFILGLIDDFLNTKPYTKLICQILVASFVTLAGFRLQWFTSLTADTIVTLLWIVGITNAFNLIDNMDGLCSGIGLIAIISLSSIFASFQAADAFSSCLIITGALSAFLIFNFNPASIFMGDSGSLVIGFIVASFTLYYSEYSKSSQILTATVPILVAMVPLLDTTLVTFIRILSGRSPSVGGRDHTSHRLVLMGFSERRAVLYLYLIGAIAGFSAYFVHQSDSFTSPAVIIPIFFSILLFGIYLSQLRVYEEKEFSRLRNHKFTPILLELTHRYQILLVLLDFFLVAFSYYLSYRLRFQTLEFAVFFDELLRSLPIVIASKITIFFFFGIYKGMWGYISTNDVFMFIKASLVGTLLSVVAVTFLYRFNNYSKGVFIIDFILSTGCLLGVRGSFRLFLETLKRRSHKGKKTVIYGAGRAGELLLREMLNNEALNVNPLGFIDDNPLKKGKKLQGYPVLGTMEDLVRFYEQHPIDGVLISFQANQADNHKALKSFCRRHKIFLKRFSIELKDVDFDA